MQCFFLSPTGLFTGCYLRSKNRRNAILKPANSIAATITITNPNTLTKKKPSNTLGSTSNIKMAEQTKVTVAKIAKEIVRVWLDLNSVITTPNKKPIHGSTHSAPKALRRLAHENHLQTPR